MSQRGNGHSLRRARALVRHAPVRPLPYDVPEVLRGCSSSFDFLQRIDHYIHVEVGKLYPDAELPSFDCDTSEPGCLRLTYRSSRPFAALAEGLIRGCVAHYGEAVDIAVEDLSDGAGTAARFLLTKRGAAP